MSASLPRLVAALGLAALAACSARVDEPRYAVGDPGVATFENASSLTAWLGGCSVFVFQREEPTGWVDHGQPIVCIWEGFAQPVLPGASRRDGFVAPAQPGTWRLRYATGLSCAADRPLSTAACKSVQDVVTPSFQVVSQCAAAACGPQLGMPNVLCADGSVGGPTNRCLRDLDTGRCGWEVRACPK